ncbi:MAG: tRNA 4-thiouridine(8) synthase ThiI [Verrucomicrobia bacterium]|nr:tRNA 4-thiouridine(8) synthase ThiI [Verrucomicrobiota bacterium]
MDRERATAQDTILIHYGELGLKGHNQREFRRRLRDNIRAKLRRLGVNWPVEETKGFLTVHGPPPEGGVSLQQALAALSEVFGIAWFSCARHLPHERFTVASRDDDFARLEAGLIELANERAGAGQTFAVRANRAEKTLPFTSTELEKRLGAVVLRETSWKKVNLTQPDVTFHVDVRHDCTFLFADKQRGPGGLPVGTAGRVLVLLSGGIDSPVAAYLMAKRGCQVDFIHFSVTAETPEQVRQSKVWRLAQRLGDFTLGSRLYVVPYTYFDLALMREKVDYDLVLFRRFVARVAEQLAGQLRAQALVSGDNLSQVASQTLSNLVATSRAAEMPVLRPLLGFDKEEIISLAKKIGTYEISIEPYKDCCALISQHPRTSSKHERLAAMEARLFPDYQRLIEQTLAEAVCLETEGTSELPPRGREANSQSPAEQTSSTGL